MEKMLLFTYLTLFCLSSVAEVSFTIKNEDLRKPGKDIHFALPEGYHFNKDAPNRVEALVKKAWVRASTFDIQNEAFVAHWDYNVDVCKGIHAELFVCDNKNTFCLPQALGFECVDGKVSISSWKPTSSSGAASTSVSTATVTETPPSPFLTESETALAQAKEKHAPLMIYFNAIWCPSCNALNETVFSTRDFSDGSSHFVRLKIDVDSPTSWPLKSKYHVTGYPTIIFADQNGDEISRVIGYRPRHEIMASLNKAFLNRDNGLEAKKLKAEKSDQAAYELGLLYLDREDYYLANYYLLKASRHWSLSDIRRNKYMSAQLGLLSQGATPEQRRAYLNLLNHALEWYPRQLEVFDRASQMADVAEELSEKALQRSALQIKIDTAKWYIKHPKALKDTDLSRGDLYEMIGDSYESLDEKQNSLDAFAEGAKEYLALIKRSGLDETSEKGINIERLYCLWKSGQVDEAQNLYEKFENQFPNEFTYYFHHARLLKALKKYSDARDKAQKAYDLAYGDNRLRVTALLAEIFILDKNNSKALNILNREIKDTKLPDDKTIRTHRYYNTLIKLRDKMSQS